MMQWLQCVEPQEYEYVPLAQGVHSGLCGEAAKLPGMHIWQPDASVVVLAQPAGQVLHQGCCDGGVGQPVCNFS